MHLTHIDARTGWTIDDAPLIEAIDALLEIAVEANHHEPSDETFKHCRLCDEWDGHRIGCPVPALQKWTEAKHDG